MIQKIETAEQQLKTLADGLDALQKIAGAMIALALKFVLILPFQSYVFAAGWGWFISPIFGIALTYWQAFGIWALLRFVVAIVGAKQDDTLSPLAHTILSLTYLLITYGTFAVIAHFLS